MIFQIILSALFVDVCLGQGALPSDWKKCPKTDMTCLTEAIQIAIKSLGAGEHTDLGFSPLDPLYFEKITLLDGKDGKGKLEYNKINVKGLTKSVIKKVEPLGNDGVKVFFSIPNFDCLGKYEMNTKLLGIPMNGAGDLEMSFGNINAAIKFTLKKVKKGSKMIYRALKTEIADFSAESFRVYHHNLFNGNKKLEESVNKALNDDWKGLIKELLQFGVVAFSDAYENLANGVLDKISADQIDLPSS